MSAESPVRRSSTTPSASVRITLTGSPASSSATESRTGVAARTSGESGSGSNRGQLDVVDVECHSRERVQDARIVSRTAPSSTRSSTRNDDRARTRAPSGALSERRDSDSGSVRSAHAVALLGAAATPPRCEARADPDGTALRRRPAGSAQGKRRDSHIETSAPAAGRCDSGHEPIASGSTRALTPGRRTRGPPPLPAPPAQSTGSAVGADHGERLSRPAPQSIALRSTTK